MNKLITYMLMLFLLVFSVSAASFDTDNSVYDLGTVSVDLTNSESVEVTIELTNTVSEDLFLKTVATTLDNGAVSINVPETSKSVGNGSTENLVFSITVDPVQAAGDYEGDLEIYNEADDTDSVTVTLKLTVNETLSVTDQNPVIPLIVVDSGTKYINWTVENNGNDDVNVNFGDFSNQLVLQGDSTKKLTLSLVTASSVDIAFEGSTVTRYRVQVDSSVTPGIYEGYVAYESLGGDMQRVLLVDVKTNAPSIDVPTSILISDAINNKLTKTFKFNIANDAYLSDSVSVNDFSVFYGENEITVDISPDSATILARSSKEFLLTFSPNGKPAGTYRGNFSVISNEGTQIVPVTVVVSNPKTSVSFPSIRAGSTSQDRNETITGTFTVQNTGDVVLNNIIISAPDMNSRYKFEIVPGYLNSLSEQQSMTVSYKLYVPVKQDSGTENIGRIKFSSDRINTTSDVYLTTGTSLAIKSVKLELDGDGYDEVCDDNEYNCDDFDIEPGKTLKVRVELRNDLPEGDSSSDNRMEDVEFTVTIIGIDGEDEDDIDKDSNRFKINADDDDYEIVEFNLPNKFPNDDTFTMEITATASVKDGPDMDLPQKVTLDLNYDRENEDVRIIDAYFSPSTIGCDRESTLRVTIANFGSDEVDEARIVVYSEYLDYLNRNIDDITLDPDPYDGDNEYTATYRISVPNNFNGDTLPFTVWAFHGTSDSDYEDYDSHIRELELRVGSCGDDIVTTTRSAVTTTTQSTVVTFDDTTTDSGDDYMFDTTEVPFTETPTYFALLALVFIVVLGLVLALIIKLLRA